MTTIDILEETYISLTANKARAGLTMLGIVIGIGSVIAMLSIGQGAQNSINSSIQSMGSNMIIIQPGAQRGAGVQVSAGRGSAKSLKLSDSEAITTQINNIAAVAPEVSARYQVTAKGTNTNTQIVGTNTSYLSVKSIEIADGNFITQQNYNSNSKVAVIGPTVQTDLFGTDTTINPIGQTIKINKLEFKIIGVTKAKGGTGFGSQDDMIYIPLTTAQKFLSGNEYLTTINVSATNSDVTTTVQTDITTLLLELHKIKDPAAADFSTLNQADVAAAASSVTQIFTILLGSIAGISLLVGGIGIMNMMLTTVTERTKEIGLRKAIGAKRESISNQFLIESLALTLLGGVFGIVLGWLISLIINLTGLVQTQVSLFAILLGVGVCTAIGILFGYYPARRASRLNPIQALRYE